MSITNLGIFTPLINKTIKQLTTSPFPFSRLVAIAYHASDLILDKVKIHTNSKIMEQQMMVIHSLRISVPNLNIHTYLYVCVCTYAHIYNAKAVLTLEFKLVLCHYCPENHTSMKWPRRSIFMLYYIIL